MVGIAPGGQRGDAALRRTHLPEEEKDESSAMPSRGYRKGISDDRTPSPRRIHTRLPESTHTRLMADAQARGIPAGHIMRALIVAHYERTALQLPQPRGLQAALLRQLGRIGNNLNQIAHEAHLMRLHLLERTALAVLDQLRRVLERL